VWVVLPFKILILTSALASVNPDYYKAAKVDGTRPLRIFTRITLPMISPMVFYLIITGFIGAFKAYSDEVAIFGTDLNAAGIEKFGVPSAELIGKCWSRMNIHVTDASEFSNEVAEFLKVFGVESIDGAIAE
jgi:ABC-type uncharacterized transport system permease subunit